MNRKKINHCLLGLLFIFYCHATSAAGDEKCNCHETATVEITRANQPIASFSVAIAETPKRRSQGLMFCHHLPSQSGMLFVYPDTDQRVFWMKNTPIELAIMFITAQGRIAAIHRGIPYELEHIYSPADIASVLEINYAEGRQLAVGDQVRWHRMKRRSPARVNQSH